MIANIYKVELQVIDLEGLTREEVISELRFSKHLSIRVKAIESRKTLWSDSHPLNNSSSYQQTFDDLFN